MKKAKSGLCRVVATGGVGESGATSLLHHKVTGKREIVMVVRNTKTSLCPNTGAIAVLVINGNVAAQGNITTARSIIQANARPRDNVVACIHTVPLFNDIACIRLGELYVTLEQCDLE